MSPAVATVAGGEQAYEVAGDGRPLVLVHAGICDHRMWDGIWGRLAAVHRVVRYDMRGFGSSSIAHGPSAPYRDLIGLLDHLEIDEAALCGVSYGGTVALETALAAPRRATALVLVCSSAGSDDAPEELAARVEEAEAAGEAGDIERAVELELQIWVDGEGRSEPIDPVVRELVREMNRTAWEGSIGSEGVVERLDPPPSERLDEVSMPALVVAGEFDVPWMTGRCRALADGIPGAWFELMRGVAHLPPLERPDAFAALVLDYLASLEG